MDTLQPLGSNRILQEFFHVYARSPDSDCGDPCCRYICLGPDEIHRSGESGFIRAGGYDLANWGRAVVLPDFRFGTGETLPQLKLHYLTLGTPHRDAGGHTDNAVLLLHGTGGNAHSLMNPLFSNVLFGPGAPLDITRYFLILPDDIGHGQSSKPSDGLHARFPAYDYDDMVRSQRLMLDEMKIDHLRLILGTSMGCMQTFVWG